MHSPALARRQSGEGLEPDLDGKKNLHSITYFICMQNQ